MVAACGLVVGCSKETSTYRFEISSNVSWSGSYKPVGRGVATLVGGTGDATIPIAYPPPVCIVVDGDGPGYIEVTAIKHVHKSGGLFASDDDQDIVQDSFRTEDPSGEAGACTE